MPTCKQLYRVVFTKELAVPACRAGIVSGCNLLYRDTPYIMTGLFLQRMQATDPDAEATPIPSRPITSETQRLLVFFPGGIGDVISLKPVLQAFREQRPEVSVAVVSSLADHCLVGDVATLYDYPIPEAIANQYDAWVNIAETDRASVGQELSETFAEFLGIECPQTAANLKVDNGLAFALQGYLADPFRPRIGIHMDSASHFRSIPRYLGALVMMSLIDKGFDCYVLGGPENRVVFTQNGAGTAPPEHIYDMTGFLGPLEHYMAFLKHMDVLLTCDTGALHIAGALGVPTVGVFGMTDGSKRTSFYPSVSYVQAEKDCSPCERVTEEVPCDNQWCLAIAEIGPEKLVQKVLEVYRENITGEDF